MRTKGFSSKGVRGRRHEWTDGGDRGDQAKVSKRRAITINTGPLYRARRGDASLPSDSVVASTSTWRP